MVKGAMKEIVKSKAERVAVLDIGTTKIACFIAELGTDGAVSIKGVGHQLSKGIKSGVITDVDDARTSIVAAVHAAEQMAGGEPVEQVVASLNGLNMKSRNVAVELTIGGDSVNDADVAELIHEGCMSLYTDEHSIIHCFPMRYHVDEVKGVRDPRHMFGRKLGGDLHVITARNSFLKNLNNCLARCHLNISEYVFAPHASALSTLERDEMDLGVTLIDLGGGTTSIAVFVGGQNIYSESLPVGGNHVTSDIAQGLSTSLHHAERLKTLHGSAIASAKDAEIMIEVPQLGEMEDEADPTMMPRSILVGVVRPRMEEIFELVRSKLDAAGVNKIAGRRCVLTGGGSQMLGLNDLAARMLNKQIRRGKPIALPGLADAVSGPAFSTVAGMIEAVTKRPWEDEILARRQSRSAVTATKERVLEWFRENF